MTACACAALDAEAADEPAEEPAIAAAAIASGPPAPSDDAEADAAAFAGSGSEGIAVATALTGVVTPCAAAAASSDVLSVDDLSDELLPVEVLLVDLPSPAFDGAGLLSLGGGASAVELESGGSSLLDCEVLDELSEGLDDAWFEDAWLEDAVSRGDGSVAEFRGGGK